MMLASFYDATTLAIVVGGTVLATTMRCGVAHARLTLGALGRLLRPRRRFDTEQVRANLARQMQDIVRNGLLRANPRSTGDAEFDEALDALFGQRSVSAFRAVLARGRHRRMAPDEAAVHTLLQAADLAPVFGLAGTLVSLSKLPANGIERSAYMVAIGMAVHATLYGLVAANLVLTPLAKMIERRMRSEDDARQRLANWLESELANAFPARPEYGAAKAGAQREQDHFADVMTAETLGAFAGFDTARNAPPAPEKRSRGRGRA